MFRVTATLVLAATAISGCAQEKQLNISDAWVRLAAVDGRPAAGYFTINGGPTDATLISVSTDVAVRTEMHETRAVEGGGMTMSAVKSVPIPALKPVSFVPGGKHAMLFNVNPTIKPGGSLTLTFTFADATRIQQTARVIGPADPAPVKK